MSAAILRQEHDNVYQCVEDEKTECLHPDNPSSEIGDHARGHDTEHEVGSDDVLRRRGQMLVGQMGEGLGVPVGLGQEPEQGR